MNQRQVAAQNVGGRLLKGSAWMIAMRWSSRLLGLASMVVVARLLTPADFGIFAVATAFIGLLDAFTDIGTDIAIIRLEAPLRQHYETAWTFKIILHAASAALIALAAPLAVAIYGDQRFELVLYVLAGSMLIAGFTNIGIADFRRNLQFHKDFQYNLVVQIAGVAATVVVAAVLRSYWALVLGGLARSVAAVVVSYVMHPYRPRPSLAARTEMFNFSFWVMLRSVAMFLTGSADRLVLGAFFPAAVTGFYSIASSLATMAVFELLLPIGRALLPGLAAKQGDSDWESRNLKTIFGGTATIAAGAALGLSVLATPAVTSVYGDQYAGAGPLLAILALSAGVGGLSQPVGQYLMVGGRVRALAVIFLMEGLASIAVTYFLADNGAGMEAIVSARLVIAVMALARVGYLVREVGTLRWGDIARAWVRPCLAGATMFAALWAAQQIFSLPPLATLAMGVPLGALIYVITLLLIWQMMGRPAGVEQEILDRIAVRGFLARP